jgi:hypothetical protein
VEDYDKQTDVYYEILEKLGVFLNPGLVHESSSALFAKIANVDNSYYLRYLEPRGPPDGTSEKLMTLITGGSKEYHKSPNCFNLTYLWIGDIFNIDRLEFCEYLEPQKIYTLEDYEKMKRGERVIPVSAEDTLQGRFFKEERWNLKSDWEKQKIIDTCWTSDIRLDTSISGCTHVKVPTGFVVCSSNIYTDRHGPDEVAAFVQWADRLKYQFQTQKLRFIFWFGR